MTEHSGPDEATAQRAAPGIDSAIDAAAKASAEYCGYDYSRSSGAIQAAWREKAEVAVRAWQEDQLRTAEEHVSAADRRRLDQKRAADQLAREGQAMRLDGDVPAVTVEDALKELRILTRCPSSKCVQNGRHHPECNKDWGPEVEIVATEIARLTAELSTLRAGRATEARLIGPMTRRIGQLAITLRRLVEAVERDDGVDMTPLWERAREVLADNSIIADAAVPAPSIPLDALRALAQGEPLDEVSGDYGVPLDVVEQVAPWVGRNAAGDRPPITTAYLMDLLDTAWGVIANAGGWRETDQEASPGWREAAERWRDTWHSVLSEWCGGELASSPPSVSPAPEQGREEPLKFPPNVDFAHMIRTLLKRADPSAQVDMPNIGICDAENSFEFGLTTDADWIADAHEVAALADMRIVKSDEDCAYRLTKVLYPYRCTCGHDKGMHDERLDGRTGTCWDCHYTETDHPICREFTAETDAPIDGLLTSPKRPENYDKDRGGDSCPDCGECRARDVLRRLVGIYSDRSGLASAWVPRWDAAWVEARALLGGES